MKHISCHTRRQRSEHGSSRWKAIVAFIWVLSALPGALPSWAFPVEAADAPSSDLALIVRSIQSAQKTLFINIYEFTSPEIAEAVLDRIDAGVQVEILEEGQPVRGLSAAGRGIATRVVQSMRAGNPKNRFYMMTSKARGKRRFRFDHGKYAIIDGRKLLIGSENYSPTGHPVAGRKGNRGWEVLLHDAQIAGEFTRLFREDADPRSEDLIDLMHLETQCVLGEFRCDFTYDYLMYAWDTPMTGFKHWLAAQGRPSSLEARDAKSILSPETSLDGLIKLIHSARHTLDIEQMTFDSNWGKDPGTSPVLDAVIEAARRGVRVRVLLNDERVFDRPDQPAKPKNRVTVPLLNQIAEQEGLNMEARIADVKRMGVTYIHNKGVLVDGDKTLVSSINWNRNSILNNRETAVVILSTDVHSHYLSLFDQDWNLSDQSSETPPDPTEPGEDPDDKTKDQLAPEHPHH